MEAQIPTTDVYQGLAWAFVLNYLVSTLPKKVSDDGIPMEAQIPTTDVYQGLPWAFVLNYLVPILSGKV